jgi:hypothetical protein
MPYQFEFDSKSGIFQCRFEGRVNDEELKEYYRAAAKVAARISPQSAVLDLSALKILEVTTDTIRELAKAPPTLPDPERPRVIIAPAAQVFGMARMFEMLGEGTRPNLHVVRTHAEAWAILRVQKPRFEPLPD